MGKLRNPSVVRRAANSFATSIPTMSLPSLTFVDISHADAALTMI
jgi:hypothetical protein